MAIYDKELFIFFNDPMLYIRALHMYTYMTKLICRIIMANICTPSKNLYNSLRRRGYFSVCVLRGAQRSKTKKKCKLAYYSPQQKMGACQICT